MSGLVLKRINGRGGSSGGLRERRSLILTSEARLIEVKYLGAAGHSIVSDVDDAGAGVDAPSEHEVFVFRASSMPLLPSTQRPASVVVAGSTCLADPAAAATAADVAADAVDPSDVAVLSILRRLVPGGDTGGATWRNEV